jgi:hypothetical protein
VPAQVPTSPLTAPPAAARPPHGMGRRPLHATAEERAARCLSADTLRSLRADFEIDGFCVLGSVLEPSTLDRIATGLDVLAAQQGATRVLRQSPEERGWHLNAGMPRTDEFVDASIVANPLLEQLVAGLLGPRPFMSFFMANTNATVESSGPRREGSDTQGLHADGPWAFPDRASAATAGDMRWPHGATSLVMNFGTEDLGEHNGGTEIWPGSHLVEEVLPIRSRPPSVDGETPPTMEELEAQRRETQPPVSAVVPRGGVLLRAYQPSLVVCMSLCVCVQPARGNFVCCCSQPRPADRIGPLRRLPTVQETSGCGTAASGTRPTDRVT